ncbi:hypothetical protein GGD38_003773 [Chitinophagaceae bacterium OAS944]|nr:hypothetical protein [Chitinophagaceae bacterium OAS944]
MAFGLKNGRSSKERVIRKRFGASQLDNKNIKRFQGTFIYRLTYHERYLCAL